MSGIPSVSLMECNLSPICIKSLAQGFHSQSHCINTTKLTLTSYSINKQSAAVLCELIISTNIKILELICCNTEHEGLVCILKLLKGHPIQELTFVASKLQVDESTGLILHDFITSAPSLKTLDLSANVGASDIGAHYTAQALRHNIILKTLNLSLCGITLPGAISLSDSLEINSSLNCLDLSRNNIGDEGIAYLCQSLQLNKTLEILNVGYCAWN